MSTTRAYSGHPLRQAVYDKWAELDMPGNHVRLLASILGMERHIHGMTAEQNHICKLLAGPNGYAVLMAWKAKHGGAKCQK